MRISKLIKNILPYFISSYFLRKKAIQRSKKIFLSPEPPIYNKDGKKLKTIYLSHNLGSNFTYGFVAGRYPLNIFWDTKNYSLKNHVYFHVNILTTIGLPERKFALFIESESIVPKDFKLFSKHKGLENDFNLIFTHSAKHLDKYDNAVFIPGGGVYYGTPLHGGGGSIVHNEQYKFKTSNISLVSSNKVMCKLHKFRLDLARHYKNSSCVNTYGNFDGGQYIKISDSLTNYRYSIVIENDITPFRFTEKILNCFASMTIPIYIGATKIGDFFNLDGIIQISRPDIDEVNKAVKMCCETDYNSRLSAIIDNYNRVQNYLCIEDYIWNNYSEHFI